MSNYATKSDLKNATAVHTSKFARKNDLTDLKSEVDRSDIDKLSQLDADKLKSVPADLNKLSDAVKNGVVKETDYNPKIKNSEDKIRSITNLATNAALDAKINEVRGEILSITNLASNSTLNAKINKVKCKVSSTANLAITAALMKVKKQLKNMKN